jgi:hypothetical protein
MFLQINNLRMNFILHRIAALIIEKRMPNEHRRIIANESISFDNVPKFKYYPPLNHFVDLTADDLMRWNRVSPDGKIGNLGLDVLYRLKDLSDLALRDIW